MSRGKLGVKEINKLVRLAALGELAHARVNGKLDTFRLGRLGELKDFGKLKEIALAGKLGRTELRSLADMGSMGILNRVCASVPMPELPDLLDAEVTGRDLCLIPALIISPPIRATISADALKPITGTKKTSITGSVDGMIDFSGSSFDLNFGVRIVPKAYC